MGDFKAALDSAEDAIKQAVPAVVRRHRGAGVLTWGLLHQIESEVLADVAATGLHSRQLLTMLRSSHHMGYPKDDSEVSLEGHEVVPVVFGEVVRAWSMVD